jgi:hypothetical protein
MLRIDRRGGSGRSWLVTAGFFRRSNMAPGARKDRKLVLEAVAPDLRRRAVSTKPCRQAMHLSALASCFSGCSLMRSSGGTALYRPTRIEALQAAKPAIQALYQALTPEPSRRTGWLASNSPIRLIRLETCTTHHRSACGGSRARADRLGYRLRARLARSAALWIAAANT